MNQIAATEETLLILLFIITAVAVAVRYVRIPYTVALVICGLVIAIFRPFHPIELTADLILLIFLPPLVFEAAFHLDYKELRENLFPILVLAVVGVLISTFVTGGMLIWLAGLPIAVAFLFGALISATDPVAVVAIFRSLGVPRRLSHIVEGESLFNDGTAIVLFNILLAIVVTNQFSLIGSLGHFLLVTVGGTVVGGFIGFLVSTILRRIDDYLIEISLTTITAYGTYLLAEHLHISGVIAVVMAGMVIGNYGASIAMSPTTRIVLTNFWEYLAFLANSLVFLLIGLAIDFNLLIDKIALIGWAVLTVLVVRALTIYLLGAPINRLKGGLPMSYRHVLFWGGLRGAISLALVLALPAAIEPWRSELRAMAFGVVLFTLVVQGTTIQWLLKKIGLINTSDRKDYEVTRAKLYAKQSALRRMEQMHLDGVISHSVWNELRQEYETEDRMLAERIHKLYKENEHLRSEEIISTRRDALRSERSALQDVHRRGMISDEAYEELIGELDHDLQKLEEH